MQINGEIFIQKWHAFCYKYVDYENWSRAD